MAADDMKSGMSVGSIVLAVLIGLCVLGIALAFFAGLQSRSIEGEESLGAGISSLLIITTCFGALDVLVSLAIIRGPIRRRISVVQAPPVKRVLGITLLSLGTIVAVVIFFFFVCGGLVWIVVTP